MEYENLKEKYPSLRKCNTGKANSIYESIESFFDDITFLIDSKLEHLLKQNDQRVKIHPRFERTSYYLLPPSFATNQEAIKNPENISNQTFHVLKYKDETLATVAETRTEINSQEFVFFERVSEVLKQKT
ncbi:MAG: hypothetical protein U9Q73_03190 [Nanoarchaeota archaeon]|nr:hypothetical protein [Nanoarchaeota archaeon]